MQTWADAGVPLAALVATTVSVAFLRPILLKRHLIDVPNHRSSHTQPTPRGGGVGIVAGLLVGMFLGAAVLIGSFDQMAAMVAIGLTVVALATLGFAEDSRGLRVATRVLIQLVVVLAASASAVLWGEFPILLGLLGSFVGVFYINAANFMDGVNGISSLHGAVVGAYFAIVGHVSNAPALTFSALAIGVSFLSFLPWNAPRARMFMGDAGSYALGGGAWALAMLALVDGASPVVAVAPLLIYATDVASTLVRRAMHGAPLIEAHHEHVYQQVQQATHSHGAASSVATLATILCAAMGLWILFVPGVMLWGIGGLLVVSLLYLSLPRLMARGQILPSTEASR